MYRSLKELNGYSIQAIDGEKGKVKNFLFDEETWVIRYLDIDLGNFFIEKRVLIPREQLGIPEWENRHFPVNLSVKRIEDSPGVMRYYSNDINVLKNFSDSCLESGNFLIRQTNLEDVFLRATGRQLND